MFAFAGFHSLPNASIVSKTWHQTRALTAARARHKLSIEAMPAIPPGLRDLRATNVAREYLSLAPRPRSRRPDNRPLRGRQQPAHDDGPRTFVCGSWSDKSLAKVFDQSYSRCVLRTSTDQHMTMTYVVEINKYSGQVLVYEHPREEDQKRLGIQLCNGDNFMGSTDWAVLKLLEVYEPVGVFIGISSLEDWSMQIGRPEFGDSIILQMPVSDHIRPQYDYVKIGRSCLSFTTPEPLTRYFAHIGNNHANINVALSSTYAYFGVHYSPRVQFRECYYESMLLDDCGEAIWERCLGPHPHRQEDGSWAYEECRYPMPHTSRHYREGRYSLNPEVI